MGRNQYDITDDDIRALRQQLLQEAMRTPEEVERDRMRKEEEEKRRKVEERERRKKAKEAAAIKAVERARQDERHLAELNNFFESQGFPRWGALLDPHLAMSHDEYLRTPLWKKIRRRVLKRDDSTCQVCESEATEVHHRSYEPDVLLGNYDEGCIALCSKCHHDVEFAERGEHRSVEQKEARLASLLNGS